MKQNINYIMHHKNAYIRMMEDDISCVDMSIYNALFLIWNRCDFDINLSINRNDVMKLAKVGNANTYTKSLKTLHEKKYIIYKPSNNPLIGSLVTIIRCDKGTDKGSAKSSDISSGISTDKGGDTLYKQYNNLTNKQINNILSYANSLSKTDFDNFINSFSSDEDKKDLDSRKLKFAHTLKEFSNIYSREMLKDFYEYWTETNENGKKFRREMQKTWNLKLRLSKWESNNKNFKNGKQQITTATKKPVRSNLAEYLGNNKQTENGNSKGEFFEDTECTIVE